MLIYKRIAEQIIYAAEDVLGTILTRYDDLASLVLDVDAVEKVLAKKDEIIERLPKTYRKTAARFFEELEKTLPEIKKALSGGSKEVSDILYNYLLSMATDGIIVFNEKQAVKTLPNIVPVPVYAKEYTRYYLFKPTPKDLAKVKEYDYIDGLILEMLKKTVKLDPESMTVKLFDREIRVKESAFIRIGLQLEDGGAVEKLVSKIIREKIGNLSFVKSFRAAALSFWMSTIMFDKDRLIDRIRRINENAPTHLLENAGFEIIIYGYDTSFTGTKRFSSDLLNIETSIKGSLDDLDSIVDTVFQNMAAVLSESLPLFAYIKELAESKGYAYTAPRSSEPTAELKKDNIRIVVAKSPLKKAGSIRVIINAKMKHNPQPLLSTLMSELDGDITVDGHTVLVSRVFGLDEIEDALEYAEETSRKLKEIISNYEQLIENKKKQVKMTTEHYVALYLAEADTFAWPDIEVVTGRPRSAIYSTVSRLIRNIAPNEYRELKEKAAYWGDSSISRSWSHKIIEILVKKRYLTIDRTGKILINGKPLDRLLREIGVDEPRAHMMYRGVLESMLKHYIYYLPELSGVRDELEALRKLGLLNKEAVTEIIKWGVPITPRVFLEKVDGKTLWELIPDKAKDTYMLSIEQEQVVEILENDALLMLMGKKYRDAILAKFVGSINIIHNKYALKAIKLLKPELITSDPKNLEKTTDINGIQLIDAGERLVGLFKLNSVNPGSDHAFMVFNKQTKEAVLVKAKTLEEAVLSTSGWDKLREEMDYIVKMSEQYRSFYTKKIDFAGTGYKALDVWLPHTVPSSILKQMAYYYRTPLGIETFYYPGLAEHIARIMEKLSETKHVKQIER